MPLPAMLSSAAAAGVILIPESKIPRNIRQGNTYTYSIMVENKGREGLFSVQVILQTQSGKIEAISEPANIGPGNKRLINVDVAIPRYAKLGRVEPLVKLFFEET